MSEPLGARSRAAARGARQAPPDDRRLRGSTLWQRAGGIVVPVADGAPRVPDRRPRRRSRPATTRSRPTGTSSTAPGLNWFWRTRRTPTSRTPPPTTSRQTLLQTTTLILTGLAVAFAFRCGLFNIGGQGQYFDRACSSRSGSASRSSTCHARRTSCSAIVARDARRRRLGRDRRLPEGDRRRARGDHDDHAQLDRRTGSGATSSGRAGRCRGRRTSRSTSRSPTTSSTSAKLPVFWGDPELQGLHIGFFIAIAALVVFWLILNRTTLGYEVRAVGFNPDAAAYGGISVRKNYFRAMAISGRVRRPRRRARHARLPVPLRHARRPGLGDRLPRDRGRAARPQHGASASASRRSSSARCSTARRTASQSSVIDPSLAGNLTQMIQGLVVLFVGADVLILVRLERAAEAGGAGASRDRSGGGGDVSTVRRHAPRAACAARRDDRRHRRDRCSASLAFLARAPADRRRARSIWPILVGIVAVALRDRAR